MSPTDAVAYNNVAAMHLSLGAEVEAERALELAIALRPTYVDARTNLAAAAALVTVARTLTWRPSLLRPRL